MDSETLPTPATPDPQSGPAQGNRPAPQGWALWWRWMVASVVGTVATDFVVKLFGRFSMDLVSQGPFWVYFLRHVCDPLLGGVLVGWTQAFALRAHLRGIAGWTFSMALSFVAGGMLWSNSLIEATGLNKVSTTTLLVVFISIPALVCAVGQYIVLRKHCGRAAWWILIFPLSCMFLCLPEAMRGWRYLPWRYADFTALFLFSAVSGLGLVLILRKPPKPSEAN